ncbi:hypothetical protein DRP53_08300 [candidate division WOR-3 bacterium]|uniref:Uncharacterized protein n=1 Tax=candidate division WOR-3 bacterium TaxID=2052148 RepID=A0A660SF14_UNCW3|nr:MAG: hypothetical protein DRP53_08300 [candidate division WOR-3 bacterium]
MSKGVKVIFEKDEDPNSHTYGQYWIIVKYPDREISEIIIEKEANILRGFAKEIGFSGHLNLHEWLKKHRPSFFKKVITDADPNGIVIKLLNELKYYFNCME